MRRSNLHQAVWHEVYFGLTLINNFSLEIIVEKTFYLVVQLFDRHLLPPVVGVVSEEVTWRC